jgi:hypothetical protein
MAQNHLTHLLCLVAKEPVVSLNADEIRNKKVDVLHAVRPVLVRWQYWDWRSRPADELNDPGSDQRCWVPKHRSGPCAVHWNWS